MSALPHTSNVDPATLFSLPDFFQRIQADPEIAGFLKNAQTFAILQGIRNNSLLYSQHRDNPHIQQIVRSLSKNLSHSIFQAIASHNRVLVEQLIRADPRLVQKGDENGFTPLHAAVKSRDANIVNFLLTHSDVNTKTSVGEFTPLHVAAQEGSPELVTLLLDAGASPELVDSTGNTALEHALSGESEGHAAVVALLIDAQTKGPVKPRPSNSSPQQMTQSLPVYTPPLVPPAASSSSSSSAFQPLSPAPAAGVNNALYANFPRMRDRNLPPAGAKPLLPLPLFCEKKHELKSMQPSYNWICDGCRAHGTGLNLHCEECKYDLCDSCVKQRRADLLEQATAGLKKIPSPAPIILSPVKIRPPLASESPHSPNANVSSPAKIRPVSPPKVVSTPPPILNRTSPHTSSSPIPSVSPSPAAIPKVGISQSGDRSSSPAGKPLPQTPTPAVASKTPPTAVGTPPPAATASPTTTATAPTALTALSSSGDGELVAQLVKLEEELQKKEEKIHELTSKVQTLEEQLLCSVCLDRQINTVLLECAHACVCLECSGTLKACPICTKAITKVLKTFRC